MSASDMDRWITAAEERLGLKFKCVTYYSADPIPEVGWCREIPSFGVSVSGDRKHNARYLILPSTAVVVQEAYQLNNGETRHRIDPLVNPGMVSLEMGGVCDSSRIVVTSEFGTALRDRVSVAIDKALWQIARKQCTVSGSAAVGAEALELHRAGYRLTDRVKAHPSCDLVIRGVGRRAASKRSG